MYYSAIGALAIIILCIENYEILLRRGDVQKQEEWINYRRFLIGVLCYYTTDCLWGIIEHGKMDRLLFVDTLVYYVAMASGVLFWTQFAVSYLNEKRTFGKLLIYSGRIFFTAMTVMVAVNIFHPVIFWVDGRCVYHARMLRHVMLDVQIILLFLTAVIAFGSMAGRRDARGKRYRTIALFGLTMAVFLFIQLWNAFLPLYTVAYMLGTCLLHTFVINDEKEEIKLRLEEAYEREKQQYQELSSARKLAYKDVLTGVKSKLAYVEVEEKKDREIDRKLISEFAVAVFDLNGLKLINDRYGHEKGDEYIINACRLICTHFKQSPVFRIGGDEFVALLEGNDYENRQELKQSFNRMMEKPQDDFSVVIAMGMADFEAGKDADFQAVFERADHDMYRQKRALKRLKRG